MVKAESLPASIVMMRMRRLCIERNDKYMRRIRVLCEDGGSAVNSIKRTADRIIGINDSHVAAHPTKENSFSSSEAGSDVGWKPEIGSSVSNRLRLVNGFEMVDSNIEAQIAE